MGNKFVKYYGEYSLKYWVKLLLKRDIIIPIDFQRPFVWNKDKVNDLIESLYSEDYVAPITIGKFVKKAKDNVKSNDYKKDDIFGKNYDNIILDGHQRLSAILFAYLNLFPKKIKENLYNNDDSIDNDNIEKEIDKKKELDFSANQVLNAIQLLYDAKKNDIKNYDDLVKELNHSGRFEDFKASKVIDFETTFMSFVYIKPFKEVLDEEEIHNERKYYANLFYNINNKGEDLSVQDSRRAMSWFISGDIGRFLNTKIDINISGREPDLQYYLAIASYVYTKINKYKNKICEATDELLKNKTSKLQKEHFVLDFIYNIENNNFNDIYGNFNEIFKDINKKREKLEEYFKILRDDNKFKFNSIAEFEIRFFGILYWGVLYEKDLNIDDYEEKVVNKLNEFTKNLNDNEINKYMKGINNISNIRDRIKYSYEIYKEEICEKASK